MSGNSTSIKVKHIIYCNCGGERISSEIKGTVEKIIQYAPVQVTILSDLCGLTALNKEKLQDLFSADMGTMVIGCYRRTMMLLFKQVNEKAFGEETEHLNLIEESVETAMRRISSFTGISSGQTNLNKISTGSNWPSWFPVIDYSRCTACGQCADFCLFGVYEKSWAKVEVVNPQGCKNNCPACARICPHTAIIFPKYKYGGAIGGSEEIDEFAEQSRQTQDIEDILGGDIYVALERRKLKRRSIVMEEAMKKALEEKEKAISESKNG